MTDLVDRIKTFAVGTSDELREGVGKRLGLGLYYAEVAALGIFIGEALTGNFNGYLAPFAADGITRMTVARNLLSLNHPFDSSKFEVPGIVGIIRDSSYE